MLKKLKKPNFDPFISTPGVKVDVNIVNNLILPPLFPLQAWIFLYLMDLK